MNDLRAVTVNGKSASLADVLKLARLDNGFPALAETIVRLLFSEEAERQGLRVSKEELQQEIDAYRKRHRLFTATDTTEFLERTGHRLADLIEFVKPQVYRRLLAAAIPSEQMAAYFHEHRSEFDLVHLSQITLKDLGVARELYFRLEEGADFHLLAREFSLDEGTRLGGGYLGARGRDELPPAVAAAVFGAEEGGIVGPIELKREILLLRVERLLPANLDADTEALIRERLLDEKLVRLEQESKVDIHLWDGLTS